MTHPDATLRAQFEQFLRNYQSRLDFADWSDDLLIEIMEHWSRQMIVRGIREAQAERIRLSGIGGSYREFNSWCEQKAAQEGEGQK